MRVPALVPMVAVLAGTVLAGMIVAGCGGPGPAALRGNPEAVVRASAGRTLAMGTARVDVTLAVDTQGTGVQGTGVANLAEGQARLTVGRTGSAAHLADRFDVVVAGATDYVEVVGGRGEGPLPGTTAARPWLEGTPGRLAADARARLSPLDTLLVRPSALTAVAFLRGAVHVVPYGGAEIRGANTMRYSIQVDLQQAVAASPPGERPALEAAAAAIGPVNWPADVWLDDQGRVRHLELAEDPEAHTTTTKGNLLIFKDTGNALPFTDVDFSDFGTPATIAIPSPDQAVEAP